MPTLAPGHSNAAATQPAPSTGQRPGAVEGRVTGSSSNTISDALRQRTLPHAQVPTSGARSGGAGAGTAMPRAASQGHAAVHAHTAGASGNRGRGARTDGRALVAAHHRQRQRQQAAESEDVDWDAVRSKASARGEEDCPVCLGAIGRNGDAGEPAGQGGYEGGSHTPCNQLKDCLKNCWRL
jgi:hypothetical protein